jgi:hypothetical protein
MNYSKGFKRDLRGSYANMDVKHKPLGHENIKVLYKIKDFYTTQLLKDFIASNNYPFILV